VLQTNPWRESVPLWQRLDALGVDTVYVADHLTHPTVAGKWWADPWTTLAAAAGVTERVRLGTLVASAAVRSPTVLARSAATLQDVSDGRFVLGLGMGVPADVLADRGAAESASQMFARYRDVVLGVRALWRGEPTHEGRRVSFSGVEPLAHVPGRTAPPLVLAAHGPQGMALVAREGDGWTTYGGPSVPGLDREAYWGVVREQATRMDAACERRARDPSTLQRSVLLGYAGYRPLDSVEIFLDEVVRAADAGFDEVAFYWPSGPPGSRFWADDEVVEAAVGRVVDGADRAGSGTAADPGSSAG
jgi:alkanesulfonate monooxygenase SsuD/methylene tetrahydromethanopterin reductase-like flavin-dependent oxidoreductase (luciferase family)